MKKQRTQTMITTLRWGAFFFVLLFLGIQAMPRGLGQRGERAFSKRPSQVEEPLRPGGATWTLTR